MTRKPVVSEEKSSEIQMIERLCGIWKKDPLIRVQHPVRTDWMMLYAIIGDLYQTYSWSEFRISAWMEFMREW